MSTGVIVSLVIIAILIIAIVVLYFLGKKAQKKQAEQKEAIDAAKQSVSMLIIDKKRMKLKDAGFPAQVVEQTPKIMRNSKVPVVKAKIGPQIMTLICDEGIFDGKIDLKVHDRDDVKVIIDNLKGIDGLQEVVQIK